MEVLRLTQPIPTLNLLTAPLSPARRPGAFASLTPQTYTCTRVACTASSTITNSNVWRQSPARTTWSTCNARPTYTCTVSLQRLLSTWSPLTVKAELLVQTTSTASVRLWPSSSNDSLPELSEYPTSNGFGIPSLLGRESCLLFLSQRKYSIAISRFMAHPTDSG